MIIRMELLGRHLVHIVYEGRSSAFFVEMAFGGKQSSRWRNYSTAERTHYHLIIEKGEHGVPGWHSG